MILAVTTVNITAEFKSSNSPDIIINYFAMCINVTSRGVLYSFSTGTKRRVIINFLKERFANGVFIKDDGYVDTDEKMKDGSYTVVTSPEADLDFEEHRYAENKRRSVLEHERRMKELEEEYHYWRIAWFQILSWRNVETVPCIGKVKRRPSSAQRRVRFDPSTTTTIVYSPNSCTMKEPFVLCKPPMRPNSLYFDLPEYRGRRTVADHKRKACSLNDIEGGWVIVNKCDFEMNKIEAAEAVPPAATTQAQTQEQGKENMAEALSNTTTLD